MRHAVATMKLLRRMADDFGRTIVIVLHDINFATAYSDRIVAMRDGRISHVGTVDDIAQRDVLRDIFGLDFDIHQIGQRRIIDFYA